MKTNENDPQECARCGMERSEWPGKGYKQDGETYCCKGCANGEECTCTESEATLEG